MSTVVNPHAKVINLKNSYLLRISKQMYTSDFLYEKKMF
jgi:hypothetical protein